MTLPLQRWPEVENALSELGLKNRCGDIDKIRAKFSQVASRGHHLMPDFTLHNVTHSDNIILILADLKKKFNFTLHPYEAYLLAASAYLHDLGMFYSKQRYIRMIAPSLKASLQFCPISTCDLINYSEVQNKTLDQQIRLTHNVLTAKWLADSEPASFGLDRTDIPYVISICRGHRKTNLQNSDCNCYHTKPVDGKIIQIGLLAGLLRLSDALDFFHNRAPDIAFEQNAFDFLNNPIALEHWIKHYFVTDPYIARRDDGGNISLDCQLNVTFPMKSINEVSYQDFFRPLFQSHIESAQVEDLHSNQYPSILLQTLGINNMVIRLVEDIQIGFRDIPREIFEDAQNSHCTNITDFLKWLNNIIDKSMQNVNKEQHAAIERISYGIMDLLETSSYSELSSKSMTLVSQMLNADTALYKYQDDSSETIVLATCSPDGFKNRLKLSCPYGEVPLTGDMLSNDKPYLLIDAHGIEGELEGVVVVQRISISRQVAEPFSDFDRTNLVVLATAIGHVLERLKQN